MNVFGYALIGKRGKRTQPNATRAENGHEFVLFTTDNEYGRRGGADGRQSQCNRAPKMDDWRVFRTGGKDRRCLLDSAIVVINPESRKNCTLVLRGYFLK